MASFLKFLKLPLLLEKGLQLVKLVKMLIVVIALTWSS